jgi:hypothetical protein
VRHRTVLHVQGHDDWRKVGCSCDAYRRLCSSPRADDREAFRPEWAIWIRSRTGRGVAPQRGGASVSRTTGIPGSRRLRPPPIHPWTSSAEGERLVPRPGHSSRPWIAGGRASVPGLVVGRSSWRACCGRRRRTFGGGLRGVCTAGGARQKDADRAGIGGGTNVGTLLRTRSNLPAASATWLRRRLPWAVGLPPTRGSRPRAGAPSDPCSPAAAPRHRRTRRTARDSRRPRRSRPGCP